MEHRTNFSLSYRVGFLCLQNNIFSERYYWNHTRHPSEKTHRFQFFKRTLWLVGSNTFLRSINIIPVNRPLSNQFRIFSVKNESQRLVEWLQMVKNESQRLVEWLQMVKNESQRLAEWMQMVKNESQRLVEWLQTVKNESQRLVEWLQMVKNESQRLVEWLQMVKWLNC